MNKVKSIKLTVLIFPLLILLGSCLGLSADITLKENGSGNLTLEYCVSNNLDALGKLDGNERWNTIPVGRADFERTIARLPGMKLLSFSSKNDGKNTVNTVKLEFESINALLAFMDSGGRRSSFSGNAQSGSLSLSFGESAEIKNPHLNEFIEDLFKPYAVKLTMNFPKEGKLLVKDNAGNAISIPGNEIVPSGKKVSFSAPVYEVLSSSGGIKLEFLW